MFPQLTLVEFAGIDDEGTFERNRAVDELAGSRYACGLFRFERPA